MAKTSTRTKLITSAERIGKTLGRAAARIDRWRGKRSAGKKAKKARPARVPVRRRRGSKSHLQTDATMRHDASAVAKAAHASQRATQKPRYRNQGR